MTYVYAIVALLVGLAAGFFFGRGSARASVAEIESTARAEADRLQAEARRIREDAEADAERRKRPLIDAAETAAPAGTGTAAAEADLTGAVAVRESERAATARRAEAEKHEPRLVQREEKLDERAAALDRKQDEILEAEKVNTRTAQSLDDRSRNLKEREATLHEKLEAIAGLSRDEARAQVGEFVVERSVSVVNLPSEDMKGRIIGREGRNIRALEAATGCDFIIDDTPETIVCSAFDPVRREIARLSIERLMADGRIHPARIEEVVEKVTTEIDKVTREAGEAAAFELGLTGLHPEVLRYMGRLKYRTSYGQNIWAHSIEVGYLCGLMAGELGLNVKLAKRAGFLHDIGKAMDQSDEGGHAIVGANFIKKYGEDELIVNAVAAHHDEVKPASVIAHLVIAGDALSGARPGARREVLESYVKRLEDLERISLSFPGVEKCYAIQAGREIRVMVAHDRVNDDQAALLSRDIARKIESELTYPGSIRVTVIREMRATEVAR